ncbi:MULTISPECIES: hypothetical protein [Pseudomonas]|jgi:hypothetical protein|uniref:Uncharacterized protein n=2 Tax=Pseudomonas TaxID=286 RepID=A0A7X1L0T7_9PSED|nr:MULTISPECIES: hypothetical protein [Pseudomonas]MBC2693206.1 hypothetical protein [Pseudomonas kielensis]MDD1011061.1 hypothetical protein [Pseudomonas shahriarae]
MIQSNDRIKDLEDVGVLFHSLIRYVEANEEERDQSLVAVGYANLLALAETAAEEVALQHKDEGDDWDGCVWFELLEKIGEGSLAESLMATEDPDVPSIVQVWLSRVE